MKFGSGTLARIASDSRLRKMRIAARKLILAFYEGRSDHSEGRVALQACCHEAEAASWPTPATVRTRYRSAIFLTG